MDAEELYIRVRNHLARMPSLDQPTDETIAWMGMAVALAEKVGPLVAWAKLNQLAADHAKDKLSNPQEIKVVLQQLLARAELNAPASSTGAFIFPGRPVDAMAAIGRVLKEAKKDVLIIDPYADDTVLTRYAVMMDEKITLRVLADKSKVYPGLKAGLAAWKIQYPNTRKVEARLASKLHDRLIFVDGEKVWVITQSLKDFAKTSHASVLEAERELGELKKQAYQDIWTGARPL